jgi:Spy/CpxP family protein refolding chaperone
MQGIVFLVLALALTAPLAAQHAPAHAGQQQRQLKALSEAEVEGYLRGEGMGYARVAELNHYPGPRHLLDLADRLPLSAEQRRAMQEVFGEMQAAAIRLGEQLVVRETELEMLFTVQQVGADDLARLLGEIGQLQAELRGTHLRAHLVTRRLLTPEQIARYDELRGYTAGRSNEHHHSGHQHR